jgi:hypothetical protein
MSLSSDKNTNSFSNGSLELFIKLINTYSIAEIEDIILLWFTSENDSDTKTNENVIISWASSYLKRVSDVLLGYQKLDFGPW